MRNYNHRLCILCQYLELKIQPYYVHSSRLYHSCVAYLARPRPLKCTLIHQFLNTTYVPLNTTGSGKKWNRCGKSFQNGWGHCWKPFLSVLECVKEHFSILSKMVCKQSVASLRFRIFRTSKQIVTCKTQEIWHYYNLFAFSLGQCSQ